MRLQAVEEEFRGEFRFLSPVEALYRRGSAAELPQRLTERGWSRPLIVSDEGVMAGPGRQILDNLRQAGMQVSVWNGVGGEPTDSSLKPGVEAAIAWGPDVIVALGGGSVMDSGKVIAVATAAGEPDVRRFLAPHGKPVGAALPLVTIPTTAGTGAEITRGTVVIDEELGVKRGFAGGGCYARLALLDPSLTDSLPPGATATSGVDAFCQSVESYLSPNAFPIGDALSLHAASLAFHHLDAAIAGQSPVARDRMMLASYLSALSFSTGAGLTFAHQFSDVAGPRTGLPHGYVCALLLPGVLASSARRKPGRVQVLADLLADGTAGGLLRAVVDLLRRAGAPPIGEVLGKDEAFALAGECFKTSGRPLPYTLDEAREVVELSYENF